MKGGTKVITHVATKAIYLLDLDNRESITSIECISASREVILPMIIMSSKVMLEKHFNNNLNANTLLAILESRYLNDHLRLKWIHHFNKFTKDKKKGT